MTKDRLEELLSEKEIPSARNNIDVVLSLHITRNAARLEKLRRDRRQTALCIAAVLVFIVCAAVLGVVLSRAEDPQQVLRGVGWISLGGMGMVLLCAPMLAWYVDEERRHEA